MLLAQVVDPGAEHTKLFIELSWVEAAAVIALGVLTALLAYALLRAMVETWRGPKT